MPQYPFVCYGILLITLITTVSKCCLFSDVDISQGSVAMHISVVGSLVITLLQICHWV